MIQLKNERFTAEIDPQGAWLTSFSDEKGDILLPKSELQQADGATKVRGGSHVCLPNFGPGGDSGLAQHGFGRMATWEVLETESKQARLTLTGGAVGYEGLVSELHYSLRQDGISMRLILMNVGDTPLAVAPAFHPYFALQDNETMVDIEGSSFDRTKMNDMQLINATSRVITTELRTIKLQSSMHSWAHWSDNLGSYICVEPTLAGYAFEERTEYQLLSGDHAEYDLSIAFL